MTSVAAVSEIPGEYAEVVDEALATISSEITSAHVVVLNRLTGGKSGASVLVCDIEPPAGVSPPEFKGQCVLKLDIVNKWEPPSRQEAPLHETAAKTEFGRRRIPRLVSSAVVNGKTAAFYEIAGRSLSLQTADALDGASLQHLCTLLAAELLSSFNRDYSRVSDRSPSEILKKWLDYRLRAQEAPDLHEFMERVTMGHNYLHVDAEVLPNPLWFAKATLPDAGVVSISLDGRLHGDLHLKNVLVRRTADRLDYWLIDFALSRPGALFFDHAYYEVALIRSYLSEPSVGRLTSVLRALDADRSSDPSSRARVPPAETGLLLALQASRRGVAEWEEQEEPNRRDSCRAQQLLARVAAGINWANKPLEDDERLVATVFAAWAAREYAREFASGVWDASIELAPTPELEGRDDALWTQVWEAAEHFDGNACLFVLVASPLTSESFLDCLGLLPWSLVVDLDAESDSTGLYADAGDVLGARRPVHQMGEIPSDVNLRNGCCWLMGDGWTSRREAAAGSLAEWRRRFLPRLRDRLVDMARQTAPDPVTVITLDADGNDNEETFRLIVEACDESFAERVRFVSIGRRRPNVADLPITFFETGVGTLLRGLRHTYGQPTDPTDPEIPGSAGPVTVSSDELHQLEEDLTLLHSNCLEATRSESTEEEFWRGNPPTWLDLHANRDVERAITRELEQKLGNALSQSRNLTLRLSHSPGAGGTTSALRAAWNLRLVHPVAVLKRYSATTLDRLDRLFHLAQRPVLLVADSSILTDATRDNLYHSLESRNARVVILHVVRTMDRVSTASGLHVRDPLTSQETQSFLRAFLLRTDDYRRQRRLRDIANDASLVRYRSPFFFGLTAYEKEFEGVDRYIASHLEEASDQTKPIMVHLALVSRFTQIGVPEALVRLWLNITAKRRLPLATIFGKDLSRLLVSHHGRVRIMHPILAEEVLRQLLAPGNSDPDAWKLNLVDSTIALLEAVADELGETAEEALLLFTQLLIKREHWSTGIRTGAAHFSELIRTCPTPHGQHRLLSRLTELCPGEAHFWNHLARHHIYQLREKYDVANEHVKKALDLAPEDSLHHHALGMVHRFWVRDVLKETIKSHEATPQPEKLLDKIRALFDTASEGFERCRELSPEDEHGYITHIQLINETANSFTRAAGVDSIVPLSTGSNAVARWLREQLALCEDLLLSVREVRGRSPESRYEVQCRTNLTALYGDFDNAIEVWEKELASSQHPGPLRQALVAAYRARSGRRWDNMSDDDLQRVVQLIEQNLRADPTDERDLRAWFAAYRRVPGFECAEALDVLGAWAGRTDSIDAHYYLYILHFMRWLNREERTEEQFLEHLQQLRQLPRPKRSFSFEWFGDAPEWCPLVHHSELGEWSKEVDFYEKTAKLKRVNGIVESISGPQAGQISLGGKVRCFFNPRKDFWKPRDINAKVNFYIGFSYDGLRAWQVEHGFVEEARSATGVASENREYEPKANAHGSFVVADGELSLEAVRQLVVEEIRRSEGSGRRLHLATLGHRLTKSYGKSLHRSLGCHSLLSLIKSFKDFEVVGDAGQEYVKLRVDT